MDNEAVKKILGIQTDETKTTQIEPHSQPMSPPQNTEPEHDNVPFFTDLDKNARRKSSSSIGSKLPLGKKLRIKQTEFNMDKIILDSDKEMRWDQLKLTIRDTQKKVVSFEEINLMGILEKGGLGTV